MLYLANWLTVLLRSITLEHSCVAVYLLIVTLAFLFVPSLWRGKESRSSEEFSLSTRTVKLQQYPNHPITSPGIVVFSNQPSNLSDLHNEKSPRQSYTAEFVTEFNFFEIIEKFEKMNEVDDIQMPFPDPPPPIPTDEELAYDKLNGIDFDDLAIGKG